MCWSVAICDVLLTSAQWSTSPSSYRSGEVRTRSDPQVQSTQPLDLEPVDVGLVRLHTGPNPGPVGSVQSGPNRGQCRNVTLVGVFSCSALFLHNTTHAEHEKTPTRVSFCVRRCSFAVQHTPSPKRYRASLVSFCVRRLSYALEHVSAPTLSTRKKHILGVFSSSATFVPPPTHAEHEKTPIVGVFSCLAS
jgi:hypothetical protein